MSFQVRGRTADVRALPTHLRLGRHTGSMSSRPRTDRRGGSSALGCLRSSAHLLFQVNLLHDLLRVAFPPLLLRVNEKPSSALPTLRHFFYPSPGSTARPSTISTFPVRLACLHYHLSHCVWWDECGADEMLAPALPFSYLLRGQEHEKLDFPRLDG